MSASIDSLYESAVKKYNKSKDKAELLRKLRDNIFSYELLRYTVQYDSEGHREFVEAGWKFLKEYDETYEKFHESTMETCDKFHKKWHNKMKEL